MGRCRQNLPKFCYLCHEEFSGDMELHDKHNTDDPNIAFPSYSAMITFPNGYGASGIYYYKSGKQEGPIVDRFTSKREDIIKRLAELRTAKPL